jgi:hypothetical protein
MTFVLFKIAIQGVTLWHFHIYIYNNSIWFISSIFLFSALVSSLWLKHFKNSIFILV